MPCRTDPMPERQEVLDAKTIRTLRNELKQSENEFTAMLCSACKTLEALGFDFGTNPLLDRWWTAHKEEDRKRELVKEQKRQHDAAKKLRKQKAILIAETKILKDLTDEDRALLAEFEMW